MSIFSSIPTRANGQLVDASWFNTIRTKLIESESGLGGAGALNLFPLGNFEDAAFTIRTGKNATFGGGGTFNGTAEISVLAADLINGAGTLKWTGDATAGNNDDCYIQFPDIDIPQGYRGERLAILFRYRWDGTTDNIKFVVKDETNTTILSASTDTLSQFLGTGSNEVGFTFTPPSNCEKISFGFQVVTGEPSKVLHVDDAIVTPDAWVQDIKTSSLVNSDLSYTWTATPLDGTEALGTFNTFTVAASGNIVTLETGSAPTQSIASMQTDGIQIFGRAFNASSTAAQPAIVKIQIGKNQHKVNISGYFNTGRTTPLSLDFGSIDGGVNQMGLWTSYDCPTGILTLSAGISESACTSRGFYEADSPTQRAHAYCYLRAGKSITVLEGEDGRKNSYGQPSAPTVNEDSTKGYLVGSHYESGGKFYLAKDVSVGAAVWHEEVDTDSAQTLTSKVIDGDDNTLQDIPLTAIKTVVGDASKFLERDGGGIPQSGKAVPAGAVVGTSDAQTLTSKTLTAPEIDEALMPEISTPSNPASGKRKLYFKSSGLYVLDNLGNEIKIDSSANKTQTVSASLPTINDDSASGHSVGSLWFQTNGVLHFATDVSVGAAVWAEMVDLNSPQNLASKTLTSPTLVTPGTDIIESSHQSTPSTPGSGYVRYYFKSDDILYKLDSSGVESRVGREGGTPFAKFDATVAPTVTNDSSENYLKGSFWYDLTAKKLYICTDESVGAAVWVEFTQNLLAQALENKTIDGDLNTVQDLPITALKTIVGDASKFLERDAGGIPISGKAVPAGTVVGTTDTQTLTNKTIDGDDNTLQDIPLTGIKTVLGDASKFIERDGSGIPISGKAVPVGAVVGSTDTQTLTNKTIDGDDNTIQDLALTSIKTELGDANKFLERDASGIPVSGKAVPTGDVVGSSDGQTLTNKTIDGDDNTVQDLSLTSFKTDGAKTNRVLARDASGVIDDAITIPAGATELVDLVGAQTIVNKNLENTVIIEMDHQTTPANPAAGSVKMYFKNDERLWKKTSAGLEALVGQEGATPFSKFDATAAPTVTNDSSENYVKGSFWYDTVSGILYYCEDESVGAAVWSAISTHGKSETLTNKTLTAPRLDAATLDFIEGDEIATPSTPATTKNRLYFKSDTELYKLNDAGVEKLVSGPKNNFGGTADPTASNDSSENYEQGSIWYNTVTRVVWICFSAGVGSAIWDEFVERTKTQTLANKDIVDGTYSGSTSTHTATTHNFTGTTTNLDSTNNNITGTTTTISATNLDVTGTTTDLDATTTNISGTTLYTDSTTVDIDSATVKITDKAPLLNSTGDDASSEGAGLLIDRTGTSGSLIYKDASETKFAIGALGSEINVVDKSTAQTISTKTHDDTNIIDPAIQWKEQSSDPTAPAATYRKLFLDDTQGFMWRENTGATEILRPQIFTMQYKITADVTGGTSSAVWRDAVLDSSSGDTRALSSLTSNQFTLIPGDYFLQGFVSSCRCASQQARLYDVSNTAVVFTGGTNWGSDGDAFPTQAHISGHFSISANTTFKIEIIVDNGHASGLGTVNSWTDATNPVVMNSINITRLK